MVKLRGGPGARMALVVCAVAVAGAGTAQARRPQEELLATEGARLGAQAAAPEAVGALAALATLDEEVDPAALESAIRGGLGRGAHPLVAAQASWLLAHLDDQRGQTKEAAALRASLGLLSHYFVIGPFGEGRASLNTVFPPELEAAAPQIGKTYPGKVHEVGWRAADGAMRDGVLYLDGLLRPADQAVAYVVVFVRSDRERAAVLRLGSPGPIKVWINGAPVFTHDVVRPSALDQDAVGIRLGRGWNRILIKTGSATARGACSRASPTRRGHRWRCGTIPARRPRPARWPAARRSRRRARRRWTACWSAGPGAWAPRAARPGAIWTLSRLGDAAGSRRPRGVGGVHAGVRAAGRGRRARGGPVARVAARGRGGDRRR